MTGRNYTASTLTLIRGFEGFEAKAYPDGGAYSIGYGSQTWEDGTPVKAGQTITKERAEKLLTHHVARFATTVNAYITVPLTQGQFDALTSFTYNVGGGALFSSTLRKKVNANPNDFTAIATEFRKWVFSKGVKLNALIARREAEILVYVGSKKKTSRVGS
ncbi:lysozyme [Runella limosa]|uniref:lysozyme n=1 Tax=Runella limosa TaxID=370978 RepID=UPI00041046CA|nr:lysozyme [Runella limosa]